MTPLSRALTGANLTFDLSAEIARLREDPSYERPGRVGRTLVKTDTLRLTLVLLAEGVEVGTHQAEGPMTVQLLEGRLHYRVGDERFELGRGEVLFFGPGHARDIRALEDTVFLLTLTGTEAEERQET